MVAKEIVAKVTEQMGDLPALSTVVSEVLRMTEDPETSTGDVCDVVQSDPALTAKVLRVSNSSYYGMRQYVGTLKLALVILGVREVRNIVLGISVFDTLSGDQEDARLVQDLWNASLRKAGFARHLSAHIGLGLQGEEFIAGLLSDIGKMGLLRQSPEEYRAMLEGGSDTAALLEAERGAFGFDHADVAMALAEHWSLPRTLSQALWYQYPHPDRELPDARDPNLAAVTRIARLASLDDFSKPGGQSSLADEEAWNILGTARNPIPPEERHDTLAAFIKELDNAPALPL